MILVALLAVLLLASASAQSPQPQPLPIAQTISISSFGAKGDGTTDDSKAFVDAITAASKAGAELRLGNSVYLLKQTLQPPRTGKPLAIVGAEHTTLMFKPDHPLDSGILIGGNSDISLESFTIRGSAPGLHHAVSILGSTNIQLDHLHVESIHGSGFLLLSAIRLGTDNQVWITNSTFTDIGAGPGQHSFILWNYYNNRSQHIYVGHNTMFGNTTDIQIALFDSDHSVVEDNAIDGGNVCVEPCKADGYGVLFYRTNVTGRYTPDTPLSIWPMPTDETVIGNRITNTAGSGIYLAGVNGAQLIGNTITRATLQMKEDLLPAAAIALNGSNDVRIFKNVIRSDAKGGVCLATTTNVVIEQNEIHDSGKWGIRLRAGKSNGKPTKPLHTTIMNNTIDGAPIGYLIEEDPSEPALTNNIETRVGRRVASPIVPGHVR